jgi:hypothetical protein
MTQASKASNVINLAEVRAARQASAQPLPVPVPPPPVRPPAPAPAPVWRQSQRGNYWARDARSGLHLVLYETRRGWAGRASTPGSDGWYVDIPPAITTLAEAQGWAEGWFAMRCSAAASQR